MNSNGKTNSDASQGVTTSAKKTYRSPALHVYGDVRAMTSSTASGGTSDGMGGLNMQKSFP